MPPRILVLLFLILTSNGDAFVLRGIGQHARTQERPPAAVPSMSSSRTPEERVKIVLANINEGEVGKRGELYFFGQLGLCGVVLVAPYAHLAPPTRAAGILLFFASGALALGSALQLGDSLSPWITPVAANELNSDGAFRLCRHPIYAGLIGVCAGLSFATVSAERLLATLLLVAFLNQKARNEETQLEELHGDAYREWASTVPRFLPEWGTLESEIDGALDGALSKIGLLKRD